jgi:rod shape-determining protein MreD
LAVRVTVLFSLAAFAALAIQTSVMHVIGVVTLVPDLLLILVVNLGLCHHNLVAAILAFALGYATDAFSGSQIGLNTFLLTMVFFVCYEVSRHLWVNNDAVGSVAVFFAVVFKDFGTLLLTGASSDLALNATRILTRVFAQALLTACLTPMMFALLRKGGKFIGLRSMSQRE